MVFRRFGALVLQDPWNFLRRVWFSGALFLWGRVRPTLAGSYLAANRRLKRAPAS